MNNSDLGIPSFDVALDDPVGSALISAALDEGQLKLAVRHIETALQGGYTLSLPLRHKPFLTALKHAHWRRWGELLRMADELSAEQMLVLTSVFVIAMKKAPLKSVMHFQTSLSAIATARDLRLATLEQPLAGKPFGLHANVC